MESDEYEASMGMLKYMQPPVLLFAFAKATCKSCLRRRHVWKTSAPIMIPSLTASLVTANPSLLIFLIIIVKVNSAFLADVLINCEKKREQNE